jgi:hypothetical protein
LTKTCDLKFIKSTRKNEQRSAWIKKGDHMRAALLTITLGFVLTGSASFAGWFQRTPTKTGNYCKDDAYVFIDQKFNGAAKIISLVKDRGADHRNGRGWYYWVQTDACEGYFVLEFGGTSTDMCTIAHYGPRPQYLSSVWASGACKQYLEHSYPWFGSWGRENPRLDYDRYYRRCYRQH